jgi:uncharacterized protein (TIGR02996 family)
MSDEDTFAHAILANPDDDLPRLVFADWLEERGRESHAELIRVQCELAQLPRRSRDPQKKARRAELAAREKELLRRPEFFPKWPEGMSTPSYEGFKRVWGPPKLKYERGFIATVVVLDGELMAPEWSRSPWRSVLDEGKILAVELYGDQGGLQTTYHFDWYEMEDLAVHPSLSRVTLIQLFEGDLTDDNLGVLARSRLLTQLRDIWFGDCKISLDAMRALVTSPSIKQLRNLWIDGATIPGSRRDSRVWQLWDLVASSPNVASLDRLWIDPLDNKAAEALLKSPHLKESLRICPDPWGRMGRAWEKWALTDGLSAANVKALRKRYPGTPF